MPESHVQSWLFEQANSKLGAVLEKEEHHPGVTIAERT